MVDWFRRTKKGLLSTKKKVIPDGLWIKCPNCSEFLYKRELERNFWICTQCQYHFRISSKEYFNILVDGEYDEFNAHIKSNDPLKFKDSKKYTDRLKEARAKTGCRICCPTFRICSIETCDPISRYLSDLLILQSSCTFPKNIISIPSDAG